MRVKICGLSKPEEVETCIKYKADFCGFILNYKKSHRYISFEQVKKLITIDKKDSSYVAVLVEPSEEELKIFSALNFDYFQLYGKYNDQDILNIKNKYKKKIITSIQVKKKEDVQNYKNVSFSSDIILWDSSGYAESVSWDYNWIKTITIKQPKMIAGNISVEKLRDISEMTDIVDASGALETNKVKDINKIKKFITTVKNINNEN
tara:strand:+ start:472 stop:1089 length:618 start_codon:yes stop_codon:yes gene_type:complete